jgi:hypothetical protein
MSCQKIYRSFQIVNAFVGRAANVYVLNAKRNNKNSYIKPLNFLSGVCLWIFFVVNFFIEIREVYSQESIQQFVGKSIVKSDRKSLHENEDATLKASTSLSNPVDTQPVIEHENGESNEKIDNSTVSRFMVTLRMIEAKERETGELHQKVKFASSLKQISAKLLPLPFKSYSLASQQNFSIDLNALKELTLYNQSTIKMKVLAHSRNKICMWLRWDDNTGLNLIDTKIYLKPGDTMILGSDSASDEGVVLAVDAGVVSGENDERTEKSIH